MFDGNHPTERNVEVVGSIGAPPPVPRNWRQTFKNGIWAAVVRGKFLFTSPRS